MNYGKSMKKNPKVFEDYTDISKGMMNVPDSVLRQSSTGYDIKGLDLVKRSSKEGKRLGKGKALKRLKL